MTDFPSPFAHHFADFGGRVWLNASHQSPLPKVAGDAAREAVSWKEHPWELTTERFSGIPDRLRHSFAQLINADTDDVILANGASYGLHLLANGLPLEAGDEVLLMEGDFPSDILPWLGLKQRGIVPRVLVPADRVLSVDEVEAAIGPNTRVLCLSWVHSFSGHVIDLKGMGALCREKNVHFIANCSQALGVRPLDIKTMPVDALVSVGWKWLLGPYATGFCWMRPDLRTRMTINQCYWLSMLTADDLGQDKLDFTLREDVGGRKYDIFSTANFFNFNALIKSLNLISEIGVDTICDHVQTLVQRLIDGLDRTHFHLLSREERHQRSTLVVVSAVDKSANERVHKALVEAGIHGAFRLGNLRFSPHLYNTAGDIDRALKVLNARQNFY